MCLVGFQVVAHTVNAAFQLQGEQFVGMLSDILGTGISLFSIMVGRVVLSLVIEQCAVHIIHFGETHVVIRFQLQVGMLYLSHALPGLLFVAFHIVELTDIGLIDIFHAFVVGEHSSAQVHGLLHVF